jgi:hypothetical protein
LNGWAWYHYGKVTKLTPLARALGDALLKRHAGVCAPLKISKAAVTPIIRDECTIPYKALCESVGAVEMTERVGDFLNELAEWCQTADLPPINSLAVNGQTGYPGTGYFLAPGCGDWEAEVAACIECKRYPATLPRKA